jgi:hypothetical protein
MTQENRPLILTPEDGCTDLFGALINTEEFLSRTLGEPLELPDLDDIESPPENDGEGWDNDLRIPVACDLPEYVEQVRDNTYNCENDFNRDFVFTVFTSPDECDWLYSSEDVLVAVTIQRYGGDPRGSSNYGSPEVYKLDDLAESGFLDWKLGWYVEWLDPDDDDQELDRLTPSFPEFGDCEPRPEIVPGESADEEGRYSTGYSSSPTHTLAEDLDDNGAGEWKGGEFYARLDGHPVRCCPDLYIGG